MFKTIEKAANKITYGFTITLSDLAAFALGGVGGYLLSIWMWR